MTNFLVPSARVRGCGRVTGPRLLVKLGCRRGRAPLEGIMPATSRVTRNFGGHKRRAGRSGRGKNGQIPFSASAREVARTAGALNVGQASHARARHGVRVPAPLLVVYRPSTIRRTAR